MKTYVLDEDKSKITWTGESTEMLGKGELKFSHGKLFTELGKVVEGFIGIDFNSLKVADDVALNDNEKQDLLNRLKSKEFLDTQHFPNAEYKILEITKEAGETKVKGILNMKKQAFGLNFPIDIKLDEKRLTAKGNFKLQNTNSVLKDKLDEEYEGNPIRDIELNFNLVAEAQTL